MGSTTISNEKNSNIILKNFEDISKSKVVINVFKMYGCILLCFNIVAILITLFTYKKIILQFRIYINLCFIPILLIFSLIEIFDTDKKKFKIENLKDKIIINDTNTISHNDINRVYMDNYIYGWIGEKPKNSHFRIGLGLGYRPYKARKVLVIEYNNNYSIKKVKFQLKYVNEKKLNRFLNLFRNQ